MRLTPDDFRADLTEKDLRTLRQEENADRLRRKREVQFVVSTNADPKLVPGEVLWLEVPRDHIRGRYLVVTTEAVTTGIRYRLVTEGRGERLPGEKLLRIERL